MIIEDPELLEAISVRLDELDRPTRGLDGFVGECLEQLPLGFTFWVILNGKRYLTCTHQPPHMLEG